MTFYMWKVGDTLSSTSREIVIVEILRLAVCGHHFLAVPRDGVLDVHEQGVRILAEVDAAALGGAVLQRGEQVRAVTNVVAQCPHICHSGPAGAERVHDVHQDFRCFHRHAYCHLTVTQLPALGR